MAIECVKVERNPRMARCGCGRLQPSSARETLAFFVDRSEGSRQATESCRNCGYYRVAHEKPGKPPAGMPKLCDNFEPHGPFEYDSYYCGCDGWD